MTTLKPKRSPAEIEDLILQKILLVTLTDSMKSDTRLVYLQLTAAEILSQDKELLLSRALMERVFIDRLSTDENPCVEPSFSYLVGCFQRANEESKKIQRMKDEKLRYEMELTCKQAMTLSVSYCRIHLAKLGMLPAVDTREKAVRLVEKMSPLLPLIFSKLSKEHGAVADNFEAQFLDMFFKEGDFESLDPIMKCLFDNLRERVVRQSVLGNFEPPLRALLYLVRDFPAGAKSFVSHELWMPPGSGRILNDHGRAMEVASVLGPFFHVSALPDTVLYESQPDVGQVCFSESRTRHPTNLLSSLSTINIEINKLHDGLKEVVYCLLKNSDTKENVLEFLATVINSNSSRARLQIDPMTCASSGMFVNLSAVMLRLCEPFLDANLTKRDKIDHKYVLFSNRMNWRELTALYASSEQVKEHVQAVSNSGNRVQYPFTCECFFMTARVLNLGLSKAISDVNHLVQERTRSQESLATLKAMLEQAPSRQLGMHIARVEEKIESSMQEELCYEAQIDRDKGLIERALSFYRLMVVWLVDLVGGFKLPLPSLCPMEFACMPEHFVEDAIGLLTFASRVPNALDGVVLDDFMNFIIMFMASPEYVRNPYLRANMVEVLNGWMPHKSGSSATASLLERHPLSLQHLVRNLLRLYVDIEFTGSHSQFYDKFNVRHSILELLEYLWQVPSHRNVWRQIAKEEEKGIYLNVLNFLINDSIYLLDESLGQILELKALEAEISNTAEWERRPAHERQEKIELFHSQENIIRADMKLANENIALLAFTSEQITSPLLLPEMVERVASMLNYFLLQLVGPRRNSFSLKNPENYEFRPKHLLKQIVSIYVHLERGDKGSVFSDAISGDGRSYNEQLFGAAADVLIRIGEDGGIIQEFVELGAKAEAAAAEAMDAENALGEIPDEFLDPIQYTLMKDPVILPSSKVTVDRTVILRHLLSDSTDPFNRSPLSPDMLFPDLELKAKIEEFVKSHSATCS